MPPASKRVYGKMQAWLGRRAPPSYSWPRAPSRVRRLGKVRSMPVPLMGS